MQTFDTIIETTHKDVHWEWTHIQYVAFQAVKTAFADIATFKYCNLDEAAVVQCDASETGLEATLIQGEQPTTITNRYLIFKT